MPVDKLPNRGHAQVVTDGPRSSPATHRSCVETSLGLRSTVKRPGREVNETSRKRARLWWSRGFAFGGPSWVHAPIAALLVLLAVSVCAEPRTWTLDKPSARVRFVVDAPLDLIRGLSSGLRGDLTLAEENWGAGAGRIRTDLSSFRTGLSLRDEDLRDQFFEVDLYPDATLSIISVEHLSTRALTVDVDAQGEAVGTLSLHGRERLVRIPISVRLSELEGDRSLQVHGSFEVALADYGIRRPARLVMKLGEVVRVSFEGTFLARAPASLSRQVAAAMSAAASVSGASRLRRASLESKVAVAFTRERRTNETTNWSFSATTPEGMGERLFADASVGGEQNVLACEGCHGVWDEKDPDAPNFVKPAVSLHDVARRPTYWRGFVSTLEEAIDICVREFMLRPNGASSEKLSRLVAYLRRISRHAAPPYDYTGVVRGRLTGIDRPTGGDPKNGEQLVGRYCVQCHNEAQWARSPLTPGLYEADYLVRRVRWIEGHDATQMPPIGLDRLPDNDLRDIVTFLAGDESMRIFKRKPRPVRAAGSEGAPASR